MDGTADVDWHGEPGLRIDGERLTAVVVPGRGGKVVSLWDAAGGRPAGRPTQRRGGGPHLPPGEWLLAPPDPLPPPARPGASFVHAEMCGWDECAPTIDACTLPNGEAAPDHGDVWARPWVDAGDGWLAVDAPALPFRLARRISPSGAGLRFSYRAEATGGRPVPFLWAAHPQLLAPPGARVLLPPEVSEVVEVHDGRHDRVPWRPSGVDDLPDGGYRKVYLDSDARVGWAALAYPDDRELRLRWDPAFVPHLGVWFDHAAVARAPVVAIEPAIGWYDRLDRAVDNGTAAVLTPGEPREWWIDVEVATATG